MQWRYLLLGSAAGAAAAWWVGNNRPMFASGLRRLADLPWAAWFRRPAERVQDNLADMVR